MKRKSRIQSIYMMLFTLLLSLVGPLFHAGIAQAATTKWLSLKYDNYNNTSLNSLLQINGNSAITGGLLRLTKSTPDQTGSVFNKSLIYNNGTHYSFSTFFSFQFTAPGNRQGFAPGADGLTFAIQTVSNKAGSVGSGIGIGGVQPSLAIKFDSFKNPELNDPSDNYIGLALNGNVNNTNLSWYKDIPKATYDMKDGKVHYAWIDYDGNAKKMSVYINNSTTRPTTAALTAPGVDLDGIFKNSVGVYAGFTSATGSAWQNHDLLKWYFTNNLDPIDTVNNNYEYQQAPASVALTTTGSVLRGKTQLTATAKDVNGQPVAGVPITFRTDNGTIEDLTGTPITPVPAVINTDANGQAQVLLNMGSVPITALGTVTAIAAGGAYQSLPIPQSPVNLSRNNVTGTSTGTNATLTWSTLTGATQYKVFDNGTLLTTVNGLTYNVTGLSAGTIHDYTVTAVANNIQSAPSGIVNISPVKTLPATATPGTAPETTKVTAEVGEGNHLLTKVSSSFIPTPLKGDAAPLPGPGITNPYLAGSDISGTDPVINKYIGIYEVDMDNKVVSFKLIILTDSDIKPKPPTLLELLVSPVNGQLEVSETESIVVKGIYSDGSIVDVTDEASYSLSNAAVATVDTKGVVKAVSVGDTTITALFGGKSASSTLLVQAGKPDISVVLTASPDSVVGDGTSTVTLTATVIDKKDNKPVEGKDVTLEGLDASPRTVTTNADGIATATFIAPQITGVIPVYKTITASATDSKALLAQTSVTIHYMPASVKGILVDKVTNKPIAGVEVSVSADFNRDGAIDFSQVVTTAADGSYQIAVPRGNWNYVMHYQTPVTIGNQTIMLTGTQTAQVGTLTGTGQQIRSENKLSGKLLLSNGANTGTPPTIDSLFGTGNVSAIVNRIDGTSFSTEILLDNDGNFDVSSLPQGQYTITFQMKTADGNVLAGRSLRTSVDESGEMGIIYSLIDPYGTVKNAITNAPLSGVTMKLYWADTALNVQNNHIPNTLVNLPELQGLAPNQNHNPQMTDARGEYAWMVFSNADYYIVATKSGYDSFNTLIPQTNVPAVNGSDSYIRNGIIHVGQDIFPFSFAMQPTDDRDPVKTLTATATPGTVSDTTKVTAVAGEGNHLLTKVSSSMIPTPLKGDAAPLPGPGVTNPYIANSNISGTDPVINKYLGIYEVDSDNKVVSFKLIILTENNIKGKPPTLVELLVSPVSGQLEEGKTQPIVVKAVFSDESIVDVTNEASYISSNAAVATVDNKGIVKAISQGTVIITASYNGKSATSTLTVQVGTPDIVLDLDASPDSVVGDGSSTITLTARVIDKTSGKPVKDKTITFQGIGSTSRTAITNADGVATVTFTAPEITGIKPVYNTITASAVDSKGLLAQRSVTVHYMPASVKGVLVDKVTGLPMAGVEVSVEADFNGDGTIDFSQKVITAADGSYQIIVPRGNWSYEMHFQAPITIGNQTVMLNRSQTAQVGTLTGTGQQIKSENELSGKLFLSNSKSSSTPSTIGSLFGTGNVSVNIDGIKGNDYSAELVLDDDGNFDVANLPQGEYTIAFQIKAPNGSILAGPLMSASVDQSGEMGVVYSLIDPYGTVKNAVTNQPISGVTMNLYWADTALNVQNNHIPNTLVDLPVLPGFAPNQNHNPQMTDVMGEYAWMVFPNADYYIVATKSGYDSFNTLIAKSNVPAVNGSDSYIDNGIIHVGQDIVAFSFAMQPKPSSNNGGTSQAAPTGLTTSDLTQTGVKLTWNAVPGATSYNIYDNGKLIASGITTTSYEVKGLAPGTNHTFTVSAVVNGVESALSLGQTISTKAAGTENTSEAQAGHHEKYINGYPDRTFKPTREVSRQEVAAILFRVYHLAKSGSEGSMYSDISKNNWGEQEILAVSKAGIMKGYPDGTFRPNKPISREEIAMIVFRLKELQVQRGVKDRFSDIAKSWASDAINAASDANLLNGYENGTFRPKANTTRAEVVTIINRLLERGPLTGVDTPSWSDVGPRYWAYGQIEEASQDHHYIIQNHVEKRVERNQ